MPIRPANDRPDAPEMMELFQAEWCPASRRVRELLTELDVSYVIRQVPVDRADRDALFAVAGSRVIPTLVLQDGTALIDEGQISTWLGDHVRTPAGASRHRAKAESRRRLEVDHAGATQARLHSLDSTQLEVSR